MGFRRMVGDCDEKRILIIWNEDCMGMKLMDDVRCLYR